MIPPSKEVRLRSIIRWMKDNNPQAASLPPEELNLIAQEKDDAMMEAFMEAEDRLMDRTSTPGQGFEERVQAINMGRMENWQEITSDMLPTSYQPSED